ncbi:helix-turn-helix domain-containing protein [Rhizobium sp. BE258]|uniref:winged helix-turn-helix transcriptional regulator n=1 Tax=Rhizobium sp. BE258 TaxID=2817722 RepID=UPI000DD67A61|nr:helix-turn-helix domain-containing protein [Rhizobium sp. BE258]MDR7144975.1 DNA-binding HxlR family transcriptional regulator [Rhizobium sp. BE258]
MRKPRPIDPRVCSIDAALKVIGDKWSLLAIRELTFGSGKFDEIVKNTGAPRDVLAAKLKSLEVFGVISKDKYEDRPVRYMYRLSESGAHLFSILHAIRDWGDKFARDDPENIVVFRHSCGSVLTPKFVCSDCGDELKADSVHSERDLHRSDLAV